jgi:hypothetical protein
MGSWTHLFGHRVIYGGDEMADFVAHGLCGDAGGGSLEIDVAGAPGAGIVRVAARSEIGHDGSGRARSDDEKLKMRTDIRQRDPPWGDVDRKGGVGRDKLGRRLGSLERSTGPVLTKCRGGVGIGGRWLLRDGFYPELGSALGGSERGGLQISPAVLYIGRQDC